MLDVSVWGGLCVEKDWEGGRVVELIMRWKAWRRLEVVGRPSTLLSVAGQAQWTETVEIVAPFPAFQKPSIPGA
jgi:hypothetical protein